MRKIASIHKLDIFLISILLAFGTAYFISKPAYNWDLLGYIGVIKSYETDSVITIHSETYESVSRALPVDNYKALLGPEKFRKIMHNDPEAFFQVIQFYSIKKLYVYAVYLLSKLGVNIVYSTIIPSILSYIVLGYIILGWIKKYFKMPYSFIFTVALIFSPPLLQIGKLSSPDALSTLIIFISFYIYIKKEKYILSILLLILSTTVRPDNIIICILIITFTCYQNKFDKRSLIVYGTLAAIAVSLCYYIRITSGAASHNILFVHTFTDQPQRLLLSQYVFDLTLKDYIYIYLKSFGNLSIHSALQMSIFLACSYWVMLNHLESIKKYHHLTGLIIVVFLCISIRYALFPSLLDRFHAPYLLIISMIFLKTLSDVSYFSKIKKRETITSQTESGSR